MTLTRILPIARAVIVISVLLTPFALDAQPVGKNGYTFRGKVDMVDVRAMTLTVSNEAVPGWDGGDDDDVPG